MNKYGILSLLIIVVTKRVKIRHQKRRSVNVVSIQSIRESLFWRGTRQMWSKIFVLGILKYQNVSVFTRHIISLKLASWKLSLLP